ncbi:uncharacterized protein K452DRAFT_314404 [Aplosporella prunicola CBS 121167]|uniref:Cell wall protein n=1 Tax=Aplosporella prunicola CBS 121167 TaxID=1176127 RepID=A0A6A6BSU7_9PEZI|nr:uncharacterized protein K452DRAFT_314404 [Aplosporella prunicola CBS 121167]KAF2147192.1 hypothetical protein K452DRAFT_314404 [Aplosporella prunicola CBS 121167]
MKQSYLFTLSLALVTVTASPVLRHKLVRREVPQEHSHEQFLRTVGKSLQEDNPDDIGDPVFALLGNAAAKKGLGKISDPDCLQQATADQAFTNAKAADDVDGMTAALVYRALERNSASVGATSKECTSIKAKNPEIAALTQHQDPASDGAAKKNKEVTLELAKQIASIGGDPQTALKAGTFKPGKKDDPTAAGNSCDDANDAEGCIFTQGLLVEDATPDEIKAAVAGTTGTSTSGNSAASNGTSVAAAGATPSAASVATGSTSTSNSNSNSNSKASSSKLDIGSATNPTIEFGPGFDNRKEDSFQPADKDEFTHGSATGVGIVTDFICQQLSDKFKASDVAIDACNQGAEAAKNKEGQAAANAFNSALGF